MKIKHNKFTTCIKCEHLIDINGKKRGDLIACPKCREKQKIGLYKTKSLYESVISNLQRDVFDQHLLNQ
jgi:DNA-directed RNA polymerase subunit RPC12/RpoP